MSKSLSNLVNNLSEGVHRIKCKFGHDDKKCETYGIKYKSCDYFLRYINFKDDLIEYKCLRNQRYDLLIHTNFLTTTIISLFYYFEKLFILMNIWMIRKNSMKQHYLKKKRFL